MSTDAPAQEDPRIRVRRVPRRVQRRRVAGQPGMPPGARYVGRPSLWGNPIPAGPGPDGRAAAVAAYRTWLAQRPEITAAARAELAGLDLACWCPPDQPCHADVLLEAANTPQPQPCPDCHGTGDVPRTRNSLTYRMCRPCGGTGTR